MATCARRYAGFNVSAPGAATNIFTAIEPNHMGSVFRVFVVLETASVFNHVVTDSAGSPVAKTCALNSGVALLANTEYEFWCAGVKTATAGTVTAPIKHSWQVATNGVIAVLTVDEVTSV